MVSYPIPRAMRTENIKKYQTNHFTLNVILAHQRAVHQSDVRFLFIPYMCCLFFSADGRFDHIPRFGQ